MKEKALHVLLVEDNARDARLLHEKLSRGKPGSFQLTHLAFDQIGLRAFLPGTRVDDQTCRA
jgi:hypothetical protein